MRIIYFLGAIFLSLTTSFCFGAAKTVSFQDLTGNAYTNLTILTVEKDGVLFRYGEEFKYVRVKFTNMSEEVQVQCGYDAKKIQGQLQQQMKERADREKLDKELSAAELAEEQAKEIDLLAYLARPIEAADFPKTDAAKKACKEIAAELNGINTAIKVGVNYAKFSDLITDAAIKVQKAKDLSGGELPIVFRLRSDDCLEAHKSARDWWARSIKTDDPDLEAMNKVLMQRKWAEAELHYTMLSGIADRLTYVNEIGMAQALELVAADKRSFLPRSVWRFKSISVLSEEEIKKRLKEKLAEKGEDKK